jgi:hypothetical protein
MAFYELRQYKVLPGQMAGWLKLMEEEIIPFQVSKGMVICGSFQGETDSSVYVWLRRFESEEQRVALYAAVYESDYWKNDISPRVPEYLDRSGMVVTRIVPTSRSTVR